MSLTETDIKNGYTRKDGTFVPGLDGTFRTLTDSGKYRTGAIDEDETPRQCNWRVWSYAEDETLIAMRSSGKTFPEIEKAIGRNASTLSKRFRHLCETGRADRKYRGQRKVRSEAIINRIMELFSQGMSGREIAKEIGVSAPTVWARIREWHLENVQRNAA